MNFTNKIKRCSQTFQKFGSLNLNILGDIDEKKHYRNKCCYDFKRKMENNSFDLLAIEHLIIIQIIKNYYIKLGIDVNKELEKRMKEVFIKNNSLNEIQLCFMIYDLEISKTLPNLISIINNYFNVYYNQLYIPKVVSVYYQLYDKKLGLKFRDNIHIYGTKTIREISKINVYYIEKYITPYSFSRVNYSNSLLIYNQIVKYLEMLPIMNYLCFGRDIYYPLKILSGMYVSRIYGITHCPITFQDMCNDINLVERNIGIKYTEKNKYIEGIDNLLGNVKNICLIVTSGRNGLKQKLCEFLVKDNRIKKIIYISCNIKTLEKDFECLVTNGNYFLTNSCISNEFSGTEYNNSMVLLEKNVI